MEKIPSLFLRDPETDLRYVTAEVNPRCQWVADGEGRATVKWDGTCVKLDDDRVWWARHQVRPERVAPAGFVAVEHDPVTGKTQGWIPANDSGYRRQLADARDKWDGLVGLPQPGTYELIGPKVGSNPHGLTSHEILKHGASTMVGVPRTYEDLAWHLREANKSIYLEGIVWHHADGRKAKIKTRDFRA